MVPACHWRGLQQRKNPGGGQQLKAVGQQHSQHPGRMNGSFHPTGSSGWLTAQPGEHFPNPPSFPCSLWAFCLLLLSSGNFMIDISPLLCLLNSCSLLVLPHRSLQQKSFYQTELFVMQIKSALYFSSSVVFIMLNDYLVTVFMP